MSHALARCLPTAGPKAGFTLIELLVGAVVLGLLVLMLFQVVALTDQAISINARKLDSAGQARLVFDRLAVDLAARPRRPDLEMSFKKAVGNDSFQFYSEVSGYANGAGQLRSVSAVNYRIQETVADRLYQLERGVAGTYWGSSNGNPVVEFTPNPLPDFSSSDASYDVLAADVFRLEFCFLLNTGVLSDTALSDYSNVTGIVIALGVLDDGSRRLLSGAQLAQLAGDLPDSNNQDPVALWTAALAPASFSGIPHTVTQNIRFYERTFNVP